MISAYLAIFYIIHPSQINYLFGCAPFNPFSRGPFSITWHISRLRVSRAGLEKDFKFLGAEFR